MLNVGLKLLALLLFAAVTSAQAADTTRKGLLLNDKIDYPTYEAKVVDVIDADTLKLEIYILPTHVQTINVRSRGIDAPEVRKAKCEQEKKLAREATASIKRKFPPGTWVYVSELSHNKYGNSWVGNIERWISDRFQSVTDELLDYDGRWGVRYDGKTKEHDWCALIAR